MSQPHTYYTAHQLEILEMMEAEMTRWVEAAFDAACLVAAVAVWFGAMGFEMARAQGF
jgi:hypothetical protein